MTLKIFYIYMTDFCIVPQSLAMQCTLVIFPFLCNFLFSLEFITVSVFNWCYFCFLGFSGGSDDKESACNVWELGLIPGLERFPGGRAWQPTPVFWPRESPWTEEPEGYSPWGLRVGHNWATKHTDNQTYSSCSLLFIFNILQSFPFPLKYS